jgi:hypothetical protein
MVGNFINYHYSFTGRFDQAAITADTPIPTGASQLELLGIAATMVTFFRQNPKEIKEIDPRNLEKLKPWGEGVPWSQFENACFIEEMSLHMRENRGSKIGGQTLMGQLAKNMNIKYGIGRSGISAKNQWYRMLRDRSGIDERGNFGTARNAGRFGGPMAVSIGARKGGVTSSRVTKKKKKASSPKKR